VKAAPPQTAFITAAAEVRAINKGKDNGAFCDVNHGRRMTSDLVSWIPSNGGF
jgi:hypothetical protein